jgi:type 2 lantibiotic biosynthesis protein LanM
MSAGFQIVDWHKALTLSERITLIRSGKIEVQENCLDSDLGKQRMKYYRSQSPFTSDSYFRQWVTSMEIDEKEILWILSDPLNLTHKTMVGSPKWLEDIMDAFSCYPVSKDNLSFSSTRTDLDGIFGFLAVIEPLIKKGCHRLHTGVQNIIQANPFVPFDAANVEEILFAHLPSRLLKILDKTMVLELNIARLDGLLNGATPRERYLSFLNLIRDRGKAIAILQEYPVLARQIACCVNQWVDYSLEFLQHLCTDWEKLNAIFSPDNDIDVLTGLEVDAGDSHRDGRTVMVAKFRTGKSIVYKPRKMQLDIHFQYLLSWLNERIKNPRFRTMKILDRDTYGWEEFILSEGCLSRRQIENFYERQGGYLALLYALNSTDFHYDNLIAAGEHPMLIDLETLFQPRIRKVCPKEADEIARNVLNYSVLNIGLLPRWMWSDDESRGIDLSGIGAEDGQITPFAIAQWEEVGTDEMRFIRKQSKIKSGRNRPTLKQAEINVLDYVEAIAAGFTHIYRTILKYRDDLLSENGPLACFCKDEIRVVLRSTQTYGVLLHESFHPDVLCDALDRDFLFNQLWVPVVNLPYLTKVIQSEIEDLQRGDIPIFTTMPSSQEIWSSSHKRIENFFEESGIDIVKRRIQNLSEDDLARQLWFIRASLATISRNEMQVRRYHLDVPQTNTSYKQLLSTARALGDRLGKLAINGQNDATWIGLKFSTVRNQISLNPLGIDLYDGLPGIALFLGYLGMVTREDHYTQLAQAALTSILHQVEERKLFITKLGAFDGWGGIIYVMSHLGTIWNQSELIAQAEEFAHIVPDLLRIDKWHDIIAGSAGCIAGLLSLHHVLPSDSVLDVAVQCGNNLVTNAKATEYGLGWISPANKERPLIGFSHGTTGIAWSLLELWGRTHDQRFRSTALSALEYERGLFSAQHGNWPDLRKFDDLDIKSDKGNRFTVAWCHGAPGIGLARLQIVKYNDDPQIRSEIHMALETTLTRGFESNHSLCHGDLGNLEFLLKASEVLDYKLKAYADSITNGIMNIIMKDGCVCGNPLGVESPGLMTGLAGIGYELLRIAEPLKVPSVLTLSPP